MAEQFHKILIITAPSGAGKTSFKQKIKNKEFAEWEMVYEGKYYGTLKSELERIWHNGQVPILDIDVKGALHVQSQYPVNTFSIFIEPPSIEELKKRLMSWYEIN